MNDVLLNWKKLHKFKGKHRSVAEDKPYSRDQIKTLLEYANLRDKSIILLMASAGLRRGALPILKVQDLTCRYSGQ
jgi:integrase